MKTKAFLCQSESHTVEEVSEAATVRKFRIVQTEGARQVNREVDFYNLDAIIAIDFIPKPMSGDVRGDV